MNRPALHLRDSDNPRGASVNASIWNHPERLAADPEYRARWEAFQAEQADNCSVIGCRRTEPCEAAESGWCGRC